MISLLQEMTDLESESSEESMENIKTLVDYLVKIFSFLLLLNTLRFIKKKYVTLPREEYMIMKKCHIWYMEDRQNNKVFTSKIMEFLNDDSALNIYKMIRHYNQDKKFNKNFL